MGKTQNKVTFRCENTIMPISFHLEMLGISIDDQLKLNNHVSNISRKVSQLIAVLRHMKKKSVILNETTRCDLYLLFCHCSALTVFTRV